MTPPGEDSKVLCSHPIEAVVLTDYWLALLSSLEEEAVEEHLFTCDACGDRLREVMALCEGLRELARSGALRVIVSDQFVRRVTETGRRVRAYAPRAGESVQCTVAADDDFLLARLAADLTGAERVDLSWLDERGVELQRMTDIPIRGEAGVVVCQEPIGLAKASPSNSMTARLVAVSAEGSEELLGEYTFHHTRTIPGPPGWEAP